MRRQQATANKRNFRLLVWWRRNCNIRSVSVLVSHSASVTARSFRLLHASYGASLPQEGGHGDTSKRAEFI
jgi:hypothetical protein